MLGVGDDVTALLGGARHDVLIVAPFIKVDALSRILACVADSVRKTIVTRWRLAEVVSGVSDLAVFDVATDAHAKLHLCRELHAKLYVADDSCLVGSANVTNTALGWRSPANVELLVRTLRSDPRIAAFEKELFAQATFATKEHRDALQELVEAGDIGKVNFDEGEPNLASFPQSWVPRARNPEELYAAYVGKEDVSYGLFRGLKAELARVGIIDGLSKSAFYAWIAEAMSQTPIVRAVTGAIDSVGELTEDGLSKILQETDAEEDVDVRDLLEVLERWLTEFLPDRYETTRNSVKLIRRRRI